MKVPPKTPAFSVPPEWEIVLGSGFVNIFQVDLSQTSNSMRQAVKYAAKW